MTGTVPVDKDLLTGTVPVNKELLTGTVPVNKELLTGRVPVNNLFLLTNTKNFFCIEDFFGPVHFWTKDFCDPKCYSTQHVFGLNFFDLTFVMTQTKIEN